MSGCLGASLAHCCTLTQSGSRPPQSYDTAITHSRNTKDNISMNVGTRLCHSSNFKSKLAFRVLKLLETASFRKRHVHFIRPTVTTAPIYREILPITCDHDHPTSGYSPFNIGAVVTVSLMKFTKACRFQQFQDAET